MGTALRAVGITDERDDAVLVAATREGDDRAFEQLYSRYQRRIAGYAHSMVGDWSRAEDITQEVFISALRRMRETDRPIAFRPWVFEIARNACIDAWRRSRRAEEVSFEADESGFAERLPGGPRTPEDAVEAGQQLDHLLGAFGALAPSHHEILVLRELEGRSYREIGEHMGLSRPSVESTLFRARRRLSEEYDELATGRRCERVQLLLEDGVGGVREQRRVSRHLTFCRVCRRRARLAGVEPGVLERAARKVAALLPLPAVLRRGRFGASAGGSHSHSLAQLAGPTLDATGPAWVKGAAAAAALALASTGAGLATRVASPTAPDHAGAAAALRQGTHTGRHHARPVDGRSTHPKLPAARPAAPAHRVTVRHHGAGAGHRRGSSRRAGGGAQHASSGAKAGRSAPARAATPGHTAPRTSRPAASAPSAAKSTPSSGASSLPAKTTSAASQAAKTVQSAAPAPLTAATGQLTSAAVGAGQRLQGTLNTTAGQLATTTQQLTAPAGKLARDTLGAATGTLLP